MSIFDSLIYLCLGILGIPVLVIGLGLIIYGIVTFYLVVFRFNLWWGLITLFFPLAIPVFIIMHGNRVKQPVFAVIGGILLLLLAASLFGGL